MRRSGPSGEPKDSIRVTSWHRVPQVHDSLLHRHYPPLSYLHRTGNCGSGCLDGTHPSHEGPSHSWHTDAQTGHAGWSQVQKSTGDTAQARQEAPSCGASLVPAREQRPVQSLGTASREGCSRDSHPGRGRTNRVADSQQRGHRNLSRCGQYILWEIRQETWISERNSRHSCGASLVESL